MEHQIPMSNLCWNSQNLVGRMSDQIRFWELKGKKLTLYFSADEVSSDESQALQALSNYWVTQIARNKDILKRAPPKNQQEEDFYNKYCDKEGKLSITAATHLMRYSVYRVNRGLTPLKLVIQMVFFMFHP